MDTIIPATTDALPPVEFRYPEGSETLWQATEPGFYAILSPNTFIVRIGRFVHHTHSRAFDTYKCDFFPPSYYSKQAILGPYATREEVRRALKLYGRLLALGPYPHAVFEEPDGATMPLGQWVNLPD